MTTTLLTRRLSFRCTLILPHFMSKHVPLEIKRKQRNSCCVSSHLRLQSPQFLELSRAVEIAVQSSHAGIQSDVDEAEGCPQEESLRMVLRNLGIPEAKLQGSLHDFPGVTWWSLWQHNKNQQKKWSKFFWDKKVVTKNRQIPWASSTIQKK